MDPLTQMVGFHDLFVTPYAPVSKKVSVNYQVPSSPLVGKVLVADLYLWLYRTKYVAKVLCALPPPPHES